MQPSATLRSFLSLAGSSLLALSSAHALTKTWGGGNLDWTNTTASGWNGAAPGGSDTANIGSGTVTVSTTITTANTPTTINLTGGVLEISAAGRLFSGAWTNAKTVNISGGATLRVNSWGYDVAGGLGALDNARARLVVNGGAIEYVGSSSSYGTRAFSVGTNGGTLKASTVGQTWTLGWDGTTDATNKITYNYVQINNSTLILGGSGNGDIAKVLENVTGTTGAVTKNGSGTWTLSGAVANTYSGVTTVTQGELDLNKTAGVDAVAGNVTINGGTLKLLADNQITNTATVSMSSGAFNLNGKSETITSFTNSGGTFSTGAGTLIGTGATISGGTNTVEAGGTLQVNSGGTGLAMSNGATMTLNSDAVTAGKLLLQDNVSISGNSTVTIASGGAASNKGTIDLGGGARTFTVADGTAATDLSVTATIANGGLTKSGAGTMELTASNTYSGGTTVSAGSLYVTGALSNSAVTVQANGTVGSNGSLTGSLGNGLSIEAGGDLDLTGATLGLNSTGILSLTGGTLTLGNLTFQDLVGWNWADAAEGTYKLIDGTFGIDWGSTSFLSEASAYDFGNGKKGYFTSGSLNVVIIPEPRAALLGGLGLLALLRRRRA